MTDPKHEPVAHLVWLQGRRGPDDVEDYYQVARPGDKCVDGSEPFPVYPASTVEALTAQLDALKEENERFSLGVQQIIDICSSRTRCGKPNAVNRIAFSLLDGPDTPSPQPREVGE